jgi:vacuolar-type H+-ATPase subunit I/STV1
MIKIEDKLSVAILSVFVVITLFYGFVHIFDGYAISFIQRVSGNSGPVDPGTVVMMGNVGWNFMFIAIGLVMTLIVPKEQGSVFLRFLVIVNFITAIRMTAFYMEGGEGGIADPGPMVMSIIAWLAVLFVYRRLGLNIGTTL